MNFTLKKARHFLKILVVFVLFCSQGGSIISHLYSNVGMRLVTRMLYSSYSHSDPWGAWSSSIMRTSLKWNKNNRAAKRGLSWILAFQSNQSEAVVLWEALGYSSGDFRQKGINLQRIGLYEESLNWLEWSIWLDADVPITWVYVGKACQMTNENGQFCEKFLIHNNDNWFLDPFFTFGSEAWRSKDDEQEEVSCEIESCVGSFGSNCVHIQVETSNIANGKGCWFQCLRLDSGEKYKYSTWLKVDVQDNGKWRPVYFQGDINEQPHGHWPGYQYGSVNWEYWEQEFIVGEYDDNLICFYPILLHHVGEAWFYYPKLFHLENE